MLDPACGTAGFLISSYKRILRANIDAKGNGTLTPDDKGRLAQNFKGYDISPDMVRLSLVNLYLHGFTDPHIAEYDTLTSQDKWNEHADVILANPPFMSPKGGIKPHKRFSIQAKRSEVLFVDYMAEHLTPGGRAGIIVPEGIIFQSQGSYTELRKMLVDNSLVAVVSLPAGVFNPYSGVKTSILILDKSLARRAQTIAFFKVENDGFGLGAQRRAIGGEELTQVQAELAAYLQALRSDRLADELQPTYGLIVAKEKIAANGDYNLNGERYRENGTTAHAFPHVRLGDVCDINPPKSEVRDLPPDTRVSFVPMADLGENRLAFEPREEKLLSEVSASYTYFKDDDVLVAKVTPCFENGKAGIARNLKSSIGFGSSEFYVLRASSTVLPEWLYFCVTHPFFRAPAVAQMTGTGGLQRVPRGYVEEFEIPLPPLEVQKEIVAEIEGYQKVINGARAVLDHYRPHIPIHPDWPMVELGDCLSSVGSGVTPKGGKETYVTQGILFIRSQNVLFGECDFSDAAYITPETHHEMSRSCVRKGDVFLNITGASIGRSAVMELDIEANVNQHVAVLRTKPELLPIFLSTFLNSDVGQRQIDWFQAGASREALNYSQIKQLKILLPPLATQQQIVAEIEVEQALVAANRELIARFEKKIQATLARVWGEDEPAPAEP